MENYIFFMHSQPATYFVSRLPLDLVIFQSDPFCLFFSYTHHSPLPPSPVKSAVTHTSPINNFPLSDSLPSFFLSFFHFLSTSSREKSAVAMVENQG